jgi:hypothetical protein
MGLIVAWMHFPVKGDAMLSEPDYLEAMRRHKNKKLKGDERIHTSMIDVLARRLNE